MAEEMNPAIVIDNGSGQVKAGRAGEDAPSVVFPSIIGRNKSTQAMQAVETKDRYIGTDAMNKRGILTLSYPVAHGVITQWDDMVAIWRSCYVDELRVEPQLQPVLLTEAPMNPKSNRETMCERMFNDLEVPGLYIQIQAVLSLYASGRTTGLVFDSGDGVSHTVPIFEGFAVKNTIFRLDLAGRDISKILQQELTKEVHTPFNTSAEFEIVRDIKEKHSYCCEDFERENQKSPEEYQVEYRLPDGESIMIGRSRYTCAEYLMKPSLFSKELDFDGAVPQIVASIKQSDIDLRAQLYGNIVLSGGTTMISGFPQRLQLDVPTHCGEVDVNVLAPNERKYSVWIGGSILASLSSFSEMQVTREEYDEEGPVCVHRKCF